MSSVIYNDENFRRLRAIKDYSILKDQQNYKWIKKGFHILFLEVDYLAKSNEPFTRIANQIDDKRNNEELSEALDYHIGLNGDISALFKEQLLELNQTGQVWLYNFYFPFNIRQIYWDMEKVISRKIQYLPFSNYKSMLYGKNIYHIHHNQANFIGYNLKRYFDRFYKNHSDFVVEIERIFNEDSNRSINEILRIFTNHIITKSTCWDERMGEWLIFLVLDDVRIHFLCLSTHDEAKAEKNDALLYRKIKDYII